MKGKFGKIFTAVLCAALVLASLSVTAFADDTVTVTYDVTYCQTEARSMLDLVNNLRTGDDGANAYAWNSSDTAYEYYDCDDLTYSYDLEAIAMQRAAEIAIYYSHTRPDGSTCWTAYNDSTIVYAVKAENIAYGGSSSNKGTSTDYFSSAEAAFTVWAEADEDYSGQGHRRNMLNESINCIGIACVYCDGYYYWVQELGYVASGDMGTVTEANDSAATVSVDIDASDVTVSSCTVDTDSLTLSENETGQAAASATVKLKMSYTRSRTGYITVNADITWTSSDTSVATVASDGTVTAIGAGTTTLTATVFGTELSVSVTVNHSYNEGVYTDPTCAADGYTTYTCTACGDSYTVTDTGSSDSVDHTWDSGTVTTEATCGTAGVITYTCTVCGATKTESIPATGNHTYGDYVSNNDATCAADGTKTATCTVCGATTTVTDEGSSANVEHTWDDGTVTTEATCGTAGVITYTCTVCGTTKTETIAATGDHTYTSEITLAATCENTGTTTYTCSVCGDTYTETIAALGHDYDFTNITWKWADDLNSATATVTCKNDASHTLMATATVTSEVTTASTCTTQGVKTYTATASFDGYDSEYTTTKTASIAVDEDAHTWGEGVVTDPTCAEDGYTTFTCTECGETKTEVGDAATGHSWQISWGDWYEGDDGWTCTATLTCENDASHVLSGTVTVASETSEDATCYSEGATVYTATATFEGVDATYTNDVTKTVYTGTASHTLTKVDEVAATCTESGTEAYWICSVCNRMFSDEAGETEIFETVTIAATGHSYTNYVSDGDATCTKDGTKTATCDNGCGTTDTVTDEGSALGHSYVSETTKEATCTEAGEITYTCSVCGDTYTETIAATGHSYTSEVTTEATCTEAGVRTYTCSVCGDTYTETIAATGHTAGDPVTENMVEPTCTEAGSYDSVVYCTVCGAEISRVTVIVEATDHTAGEPVVENEVAATCTEDGSYDSVVYCTECGAEISRETITIAATGHSYGSVVTEPTCTEGGYTTYTCSICGDTYTADETAATGHSYVSTVTTAATETKDGLMTWTCSVCGDTYTEVIPATGHSWDSDSVVVTWADDYSSVTVTWTCSVCDETWSATTTEIYTYTDDNGETVYYAILDDPENTGGYYADSSVTSGSSDDSDDTDGSDDSTADGSDDSDDTTDDGSDDSTSGSTGSSTTTTSSDSDATGSVSAADTGDSMNTVLWITILAAAAVCILIGRKKIAK